MIDPRYNGESGIYVSMQVLTRADIINHIKKLDPLLETVPYMSLHCTIIYSMTTGISLQESDLSLDITVVAPSKLTYWEGHDKQGYLVLELNSAELLERNEFYTSLGAKHASDTYNPHITIAKGLSKEVADNVIARYDKDPLTATLLLSAESVENP